MLEQIWALFERAGIPCLFHLVTGAYCPGCGGTRAAKAQLAGQIAASLRYNPVVCYGALVLAGFALFWLYARFRHKKSPELRRMEIFLYGGLLIALVNCIYKNYMLFARGVGLLS